VGGYDDWIRQARPFDRPPKSEMPPKERSPKRESTPKEKQKLSYKESIELEALPRMIEALEQEKRSLIATLNSSAFYASYDAGKMRETNDRLQAVEKALDEAYHRWDELETLVVKYNAMRAERGTAS
jgi:ATP-binding cassette subfamily F protein uup